ncbi:hypothetical protein PGC35_14375 [Psychrobacillus sp. PGGUH221]|uniref:hypothetical protein n=1 Tax=Psychrobacillus sp. PGGUH221 TaxID=3020058 RepID=UPI0035C75191
MQIETFRNMNLYDKALDLCFSSYLFIEKHQSQITMEDAFKIRRMVTRIPVKIATAIGQNNMKLRFKRLNEAKIELQNFEQMLDKIHEKVDLIYEYGFEVDYYSGELMRLMNGYFGWLKRNYKD